MQNDLLQLLIDAKLAGSSREGGGGYWFRSNEEAAELALDVLGVWLEEHVDPDQLVIQAAHAVVKHYAASDVLSPSEAALVAAVIRLP